MSASSKYLLDIMSRVESPFHAIAAEALDNTPDVPEALANGFVAAPVATSSEVDAQERESVMPVLEFNAGSGNTEVADKIGSLEPEHTPVRQERKVSFEGGAEVSEIVTKKSKKRTNVWTKTSSRKTAKKVKNNGIRLSDSKDDNVLLKPFHQEDDPSYPILLSKIYKAEKIELSADRLTASGSKGYRMVRATRGVVEGAWYFEIYVDRLGDTGHTRLGWSTRRGDLQAPVGYDAHSYSYRDLDGCKVHSALREGYGDAYNEKDVIGFYINLPREPGFTRKPEEVVGYKGHPYIIVADEPLYPLPGSEILFFKNGVCQGVAFKDVNDGAYFPAASMYTLPSEDCCQVVFNFGPDFMYPVSDLGDRPLPSPMCQASGPGKARMETVPSTQTVAIVDSTVNGGGNWMVPGNGNTMAVVEVTESTKDENAPKEVEKVPPGAEKKVKIFKAPVGNNITPHSSISVKSGGFQLHPGSKTDAYFKSFKNDTIRLEVGSTSLLSQMGAKKDTAGTRLPNPEGSQKDKGLLDLNGIPNNRGLSNLGAVVQEGKRKLNLKGSQKVNGPDLKGSKKVSVTEVTTSKSVKQNVTVFGISSVKGTGLQGCKGNQRNFQESRECVAAAGLNSSNGDKREIPMSGLPKPKKNKTVYTGNELILNPSKDLNGTGSALKTSKKDLLETVVAHLGRKDGHGTEPGPTNMKILPGTGPVDKSSGRGFPGTGSAQKPSKKDLPGIVSVQNPSKKVLPRPGSVLKPSKKDLPGTGSVHKPSKKGFNGSGYLPRGSSSAFIGGKSWGDGIRGTTMDVDVVVVKCSAGIHGEGPSR